MSDTIQETIDELRQTLTDYIEATYHIGHPLMIEQRRHLLAQVGGIFQRPYLEFDAPLRYGRILPKHDRVAGRGSRSLRGPS